jgi:hypothetical protein
VYADLAPALYVLVGLFACGLASRDLLARPARPLSATVMAGYALVFGFAPAFLFWDVQDELVARRTSFACVLAFFGLVVGTLAGRRAAGEAAHFRWDQFSWVPGRRWVFVICGVLGVVGFFLLAVGAAGSVSAYLDAGRFEHRDRSVPAMSLLGGHMLRLAGIPAIALSLSPRRRHRYVGRILGAAVAIGVFIGTQGSRSFALGLLIALLFAALFHPGTRRSRTSPRPLRLIVGGVLALLLTITLASGMYFARRSLHVDPSTTWSTTQAGLESVGVFDREPLNYSTHLARGVAVIPEQVPFEWLSPVRRLLLFPMQSGGLKPRDPNLLFGQAIGTRVLGTTVPPSLPGEGYFVLGGLLGVAPWAAMYGFLIAWVESRQNRFVIGLVILATGFEQSLLLLRGQFYEVSVRIAVVWLLCLLLGRVLLSPDDVGDAAVARPRGR